MLRGITKWKYISHAHEAQSWCSLWVVSWGSRPISCDSETPAFLFGTTTQRHICVIQPAILREENPGDHMPHT